MLTAISLGFENYAETVYFQVLLMLKMKIHQPELSLCYANSVLHLGYIGYGPSGSLSQIFGAPDHNFGGPIINVDIYHLLI